MRCKITLVCAILQVFRGFFYFYHSIKDNCAWGIYANYRELPVNNKQRVQRGNNLHNGGVALRAKIIMVLRFNQCTKHKAQ